VRSTYRNPSTRFSAGTPTKQTKARATLPSTNQRKRRWRDERSTTTSTTAADFKPHSLFNNVPLALLAMLATQHAHQFNHVQTPAKTVVKHEHQDAPLDLSRSTPTTVVGNGAQLVVAPVKMPDGTMVREFWREIQKLLSW